MRTHVLRREDVLEAVRDVLVGFPEVRLAYVFGSVVSQGFSSHDVDIAVLIESSDELETISNLIDELSRRLRVPEDLIDVVDLRRVRPQVKLRVLREGVKVIDRGDYERVVYEEAMSWCRLYCEDLSYIYDRFLREDPGIDRELMLSRLNEVLRCKSLLETYVDNDVSYFLNDLEKAFALERAMHRLIEAMLDICRHVVTAERLGVPERYSDCTRLLEERGLMSRELSESLQDLARLRNVLVHRYAEISYDLLLRKAKEVVHEVVPKFLEWTRSLLKRTVQNEST